MLLVPWEGVCGLSVVDCMLSVASRRVAMRRPRRRGSPPSSWRRACGRTASHWSSRRLAAVASLAVVASPADAVVAPAAGAEAGAGAAVAPVGAAAAAGVGAAGASDVLAVGDM